MKGARGAELWSPVCIQILAKKVYTLYSLAVQQLSRQDHYDFGLRALTSLLRYAGKKRRLQPDLSDEEVGQARSPRTSALLALARRHCHGSSAHAPVPAATSSCFVPESPDCCGVAGTDSGLSPCRSCCCP